MQNFKHIRVEISMAARELLWGVLFLALINGVSISKIKSAKYEHNGQVCYMCGRGYRVLEHCTEDGTQSNCGPCPNGTYNPDVTKSKDCRRCREPCRLEEDEVSPCQNISDRRCACKRGLAKQVYENTPNGYHCNNCSSLGKVYWEGEKAGRQVQECREPCSDGQFLSNSSECIPCTNCTAKGLLTKANCTTIADAQCTKAEEIQQPVNLSLLWILPFGVVLVALAGGGVYKYCRKNRKVSYKLPLCPADQFIDMGEDDNENL